MDARAPAYVSAVAGADVADGWRERLGRFCHDMASGCHAISCVAPALP